MRPVAILACVFTVLSLAGCQLYQVRGEVGGVELEASTDRGNGDFCPPGQRKKGNC
jgi:hypothetical protein